MELYNGELYWDKTGATDLKIKPSRPASHYDVLVVGGGISGSLSAYTLAKEGLTVAVIDKGRIGQGSTMANTGLLQYCNDIMLSELIKKIGEVKAVRFYSLCRDVIDQLENISNSLEINADFKRRSSLYFASDPSDVKKLQREYETLKKFGFKTEFLTEEQMKSLFPFAKPAALITHGDAEFNPLRFSKGLLHFLNEHEHVDIFENTEFIDMETDESGITVKTSHECFRAANILFATGYQQPPYLSGTRADLNRSFAIATEPIKDLSIWKDSMLIWETKRPYLYLRTTCDGRIIAGGLDEDKPEAPKNEELIKKRSERLKQEIEKLFPTLEVKIAYAWAAIFGESIDSLPYIGRHPSRKNLYYLLGYGGNGTVYSMIGAVIIRDLIKGKENLDAEIVKLNR